MITLDDQYRLEDFGFKALVGHIDPVTPVFANKTLSIMGRPGAYDFGSEIQEKTFSIPVNIMTETDNELQEKLNKLNGFLFDSFGKPKILKLVFDYEPDKFYMVKLANQIPIDRRFVLSKMSIDFIAYDPYKYSGVYADEITWGSEKVTFEYSYLLGREGLSTAITITSPQNIPVDINGLAVKPIFEITGSATNLIITANNEKINVGTFANTTWVIDTETFTSEKNGVETMLDMNHFWLLPGKQIINFSGANLNFTVRIKYRDKYQ